ncbi:MAG: Mur ligase family protein [Kangiellaceae bacterium]|jgi:dihydrofolate synthase/folylpolyglutamate synthase|nr:Mur ligase family protein [Kangiellaceae bacterium]
MKSLSDWLDYIESLHPANIDLTLDRCLQVAKVLGLTQFDSKVITVAGTNGKGSTVAFMESLVAREGFSVAAYTSPHIIDFNERLRFNQVNIDDQYWVDAFNQVENARSDITLTYFEYTTLAALVIIKHLRPDVILLEVGLGGRLDTVNIVDNDVAVITSIGFDHQDYLGDTLDSIAREKAGIANTAELVIYADQEVENLCRRHIHSANQQFNASSYLVDEFASDITELATQQVLIHPTNFAAALTTYKQLFRAPSLPIVTDALDSMVLKGRWMKANEQLNIWLDVAHNEQAIDFLFGKIERTHFARWHAICGFLQDKSVEKSLANLSDKMTSWLTLSTEGPRGLTASKLAMQLNQQSITDVTMAATDTDIIDWLAERIGEDEAIVVFGSFLVVSAIMKLLKTSYAREKLLN